MVLRMIDIGANLTDPVFKGIYRSRKKHASDFSAMLDRATAAGVEKIIITAGTLTESVDALALARTDDRLVSTLGVHPTRCNEFEAHQEGPQAYFNALESVLMDGKSDGKIVAIGEFGLDYDRLEFCDKATQKNYFNKQFDLVSASDGLPLFLHNRNTGGEFATMIRARRDDFKEGVVHSFTGTAEDVEELLALDLFIGINGCSLKTQANLQVVKTIPIERLMVETDAPWCDIRRTHDSFAHVTTHWESKKAEKFQPGTCVKGRNEPCTTLQVLEVLAALHEMDITTLSRTIFNTTSRVFL